jgi:hypothetical protein
VAQLKKEKDKIARQAALTAQEVQKKRKNDSEKMQKKANKRVESISNGLSVCGAIIPFGGVDMFVLLPFLKNIMRACAEEFLCKDDLTDGFIDSVARRELPDDMTAGSWIKGVPVIGAVVGGVWNGVVFKDLGRAFGKRVVDAMFSLKCRGEDIDDQTLRRELLIW